MRPHIFVTSAAVPGLRQVEDVRQAIAAGHAAAIWGRITALAGADLGTAPLTPASLFTGRDPNQARHANPDYTVCHAAGQRILRAALVCLLTGNTRYRDLALQQLESLFDPAQWPEWRDQAHFRNPADLRTGMLAHDTALVYDWLHPFLRQDQRKWIVAGIDRCAIQPFWKSVDQGAWWTERRNNWLACVVGGLGTAGMALGGDHADAERLIAYSLPRMRGYLEIYGPEGEFNESVAYANATLLPADYFSAWRYHTRDGENLLAAHPFPAACRWMLYMTLPPGRVAAFGDAHVDAPPRVQHVAAVAAAAADPLLQWFYLAHAGAWSDPRQVLWFDAQLEPRPPHYDLPLGRAFPAHGGCVSNRTSWNSRRTECVVYGKAGREENHGHDDVGQLCIDGRGQRLIRDLGAPSIYPADFFGPQRNAYYNASGFGHNVLMFGDREMRTGPDAGGRFLFAEFDAVRGAVWQIDCTPAYEGARRVRRTVVHLLPGVVSVLDEAELERPEQIRLRWHTADRSEPDAIGCFLVQQQNERLACRVIALNGAKLTLTRGQHAYAPPYDKARTGDPLEQRHESYVQAEMENGSCRLLTLFALLPPDMPVRWRSGQPAATGEEVWRLDAAGRSCRVAVTDETMVVECPERETRRWEVPLT